MTIFRNCTAVSEDTLAWASRFTEPAFIAAPYHEIIISSRPIARLNDLTEQEEKSLWNFAHHRANSILQDNDIAAIALLMNDGEASGQTVGHAHIHVVGFSSDKMTTSLKRDLDRLHDKFSLEHTKPFIEVDVTISPTDISALRSLRLDLAAYSKGAGFSIFTDVPFSSKEDNLSLTLQAWNTNAPRQFGTTNLLRVWNGYRTEPYTWPAENKTRNFAKESIA